VRFVAHPTGVEPITFSVGG